MTVDVETAVVVDRPRQQVAAFTGDPDNTVRWYANIRSVTWQTPRPARVGSRFAFVARFLGRTLAYTYEVRELVPGELLVMSTADGPFPMETTYRWTDDGEGRTRMTLRNRGEPTGYSRLVAPLMGTAVRRANRKDLRRLKVLLEQGGADSR